MKEKLTLGEAFPTLGARIITAYLAAYPDFVPPADGTDMESHRELHAFFQDMISALRRHPDWIGIAEGPDRCFAERWLLNNSNPELTDAMSKIEKKFFDWVGILHKLGATGEVRNGGLLVLRSAWKPTAKILDRLRLFGLESENTPEGVLLRCAAYPSIFPAWKNRSMNTPQKEWQISYLTCFLFGSQSGRPCRAMEMFGKLYDDPKWLFELESFFEKLGYTFSNDERGLQVRWEKEYPGKERGYLHISYRYRDRLQMCFEFRVPAFRLLLGHYNEMEYELGELCFTRTKVCDNCGYCTQTDKSGQRKKLALPLKYPGGEMLKCPLWPWFTWNELDEKMIAKMEKLFLFAEEKLYGQANQ